MSVYVQQSLRHLTLELLNLQGTDTGKNRFLCPQDGLLSAGYTDFISRIYNQIPQVTSDGKRLQVCFRLFVLLTMMAYSQIAADIVIYLRLTCRRKLFFRASAKSPSSPGHRMLGHSAFIRRKEVV